MTLSRPIRVAAVSALLLGCNADATSKPADCATLPAGSERDMCVFDELAAGGAATVAAARERIATIGDPVVRSAAVVAWLDAHPKLSPPEAEQMCSLLDGTERLACQRRANSPHLRR